MVPAAGQGALAIQVRAGDEETAAAARAIGDGDALREFSAERAVVALLEAGCATPLGVHARVAGERLEIDAFVGLPSGAEWLRDSFEGDAAEPVAAGRALAERLLSAGAREILDRAEREAAHDKSRSMARKPRLCAAANEQGGSGVAPATGSSTWSEPARVTRG